MGTIVNTATVPSALGSTYKYITELGSTAQTISAAAGSVYFVEVDNANNPEEIASVKLYDSASPTVGSDNPAMILTCPKGTVQAFPFPEGVAFSTAITIACIKELGTGSTTTNPDNDVNVKVYI